MIGAALSFVTSRAGLVAIALVFGYIAGHSAARNGEAVRALRAENAALEQSLAISRAAAKAAEEEAQALRSLQDELEKKVEAYANDLASRPDADVCRLSGGDIERLRGLR